MVKRIKELEAELLQVKKGKGSVGWKEEARRMGSTKTPSTKEALDNEVEDVPNDPEPEKDAIDETKVKEEMEVYFFQPSIPTVTCLVCILS